MFNQQRLRPALLSTLAVILLLMAFAGAPDTSLSRASNAAPAAVTPTLPPLECALLTPFKASNFPSSPNINNPWLPLVPGTKLVLDGRTNVGGQPLARQVVTIVTDLTKVVHGVRTVVLWDRDFSQGVLAESELAFHAQDSAGNIWNLGEYPATYKGGKFSEAADTWISGLAGAQGGTIIPGSPQAGTPSFLQAYAPPRKAGDPSVIYDCGQVAAVGQQAPPLCVPVGCYTNVLTVDEHSPEEAGIQQKYYAQAVGNFKVGATDNDPQGETLVLSETVRLSRDECVAARQAALALEDQAYHHDTSQTVYAQTTPMEQTGLCETLRPTATATRTATPTGTPPTATRTPTVTPTGGPRRSFYLPYAARALPTPSATPTPTVPPAIFDGCMSDPNPAGAANYPVRIVSVDKVAEIVTLQNVSDQIVSVEDWNMCSINGNQEHDQIYGTLGPGQIRAFPNTGDGPIWNDTQRDDGALYNAGGFLVSYWVDQ